MRGGVLNDDSASPVFAVRRSLELNRCIHMSNQIHRVGDFHLKWNFARLRPNHILRRRRFRRGFSELMSSTGERPSKMSGRIQNDAFHCGLRSPDLCHYSTKRIHHISLFVKLLARRVKLKRTNEKETESTFWEKRVRRLTVGFCLIFRVLSVTKNEISGHSTNLGRTKKFKIAILAIPN